MLAVVTGPPSSGSATGTLTVYNPVTTVATVTPSVGPTYAGTPVTITGTGFRPGAVVQFGGVPAGATYVNDTMMVVYPPAALSAGSVAVAVRNAEPALAGSASGSYTYLSYPEVTSLFPVFGASGTSVTVTGRNFSDADVSISFGGVAASVSSQSEVEVVVTVPAGLPAGLTDITVTNVAQGRSSVYPRVFTVGASPSNGARLVAVGWDHVCAATGSAVKCWGSNSSGQLGDGTTVNRTTPLTSWV